ncbi:hypothetical protein [Streptococcus porcinus]|uniref:CopG family transcriptional regulator n=2 Tax=Streptococcus porcinus TaxID=1340 RepID=A0A4V0GZH7_STRPO|nr:hypothetical protein [Streptococcus porcinus]EGJ27701.1 conserved domain protein [Streptococcus porcinus str. Jelinkova 176]SQG43143.1 Uncharacterised protein [Streptococcus porcinus]VTT42164.1 Uncharacterised protein [Streptococcus porcinus]VTT43621.1 Uncharacterised protein [Streptococcus porcinus]
MSESTSICLSDDLNQQLNFWTSAYHISKSEFINQIIREKLDSLYAIQEANLAMRDWIKEHQNSYFSPIK